MLQMIDGANAVQFSRAVRVWLKLGLHASDPRDVVAPCTAKNKKICLKRSRREDARPQGSAVRPPRARSAVQHNSVCGAQASKLLIFMDGGGLCWWQGFSTVRFVHCRHCRGGARSTVVRLRRDTVQHRRPRPTRDSAGHETAITVSPF